MIFLPNDHFSVNFYIFFLWFKSLVVSTQPKFKCIVLFIARAKNQSQTNMNIIDWESERQSNNKKKNPGKRTESLLCQQKYLMQVN